MECLKSSREFCLSVLRPRVWENVLHDQDLLRNDINNYVKHGGQILTAQSDIFERFFINDPRGRLDWIPDFLSNSSEPWLIDDFSSLQICLIGTLAHVDAVFRNRLKRELASYRSPASLGRTHFADNLFEITFGTASIENHFRTLDGYQRSKFLSVLCRKGSISMMKIFIDLGVDVHGGYWNWNLLGSAAAAGNMEIVCMLLEAGANGSLALKRFLDENKHLSDALFRRLLGMLVENARPTSFEPVDDPVLSILASRRALHFYPQAPEILLTRKVFSDIGFGGGTIKQAYWRSYQYNYMYRAILGKSSSTVDLLLQKGAHANARISHSVDCKGYWFKSCTWITFSVMCGAASCADILIQHGADVTALDGAGRSADQLAMTNEFAPHPRSLENWRDDSSYNCDPPRSVTAEEDAETLAVVERAFNLKFRGSRSLLKDYIQLSDEPTLQPPPWQDEPVSIIRKTLEKALGIVLTPTQTRLLCDRLRVLYLAIREFWSLSFYEALLMRLIYVLSYIILLALETLAFIKGHKRIPMPSRSLLSAAAVLMLALVWGSSQMGVSWGAITAGSKSETDS